MPYEHYMHPRLAALCDLDSGWSPDRDFYLALAGPERQRILDLGCGTGHARRCATGIGRDEH